jgi:hypothetical protein
MNEALDWKNWRWVPSPQSNRMSSRSVSSAIALAERSFVGHEPAVPRNVTRIARRTGFRVKAGRDASGAGRTGWGKEEKGGWRRSREW